MFKNTLASTPLTTEAAESYFSGKIEGGSWARDFSFLTTLRALLDHRMKDGDSLLLSFLDVTPSAGKIEEFGNVRRAIRYIVDTDYAGSAHSIHIHNFRSIYPDDNKAWMDLIEANFRETYEGWHRVEKVTAFFRKVFNVLCFINPELKSVILFTDNMDIRRMHYLQCGIFAFLPWYFDPDAGVTELEMELINSLREKTSDKYEACIAKIAEQYDFETQRIRSLLKGFESRFEVEQRQSVQNEIDTIVRRLNDLDRQYGEYLRRKREQENILFGLEMKLGQNGEESELMDYFLRNKQLILESVDGPRMRFYVRATLDYFDEDLASRVINNEGSCLYRDRGTNAQLTVEEMKLLMTEIFLKRTLRIRFCAEYGFRIGGSVEGLMDCSYPSSCAEYLPNPHIDNYGCLGNNQMIINERLRESDYIGAIGQCVASAKSLNFGDSAVMGRFASKIYNSTKRFIESPDGTVMTVKEAVQWIKNQQEEV